MTRLGHGLIPKGRRRIVTHNVRVGRRGSEVRANVRKLARRYRPHVITLQEARPYIDDLRDLRGYKLFTPKGKSSEAGNCITLMREPSAAGEYVKKALRLHTRWRGPKAGKEHPGRVFLAVSDGLWTVVNVHRTRPDWSAGGKAFAEEFGALLASAESTEGVWVCVGDQNIGTRPDDKRMKYGPWQLARRIRAEVVTTSPGHIDYAIARGADGKAKRLGHYGSDHAAVLIKLKEK